MVLFMLEVCIKLIALRCSYFLGNGGMMNTMEFGLVVCTVFESVYSFNVRQARMLRGFRVLRVIRIVSAFRQLRQLVCSLYNSMAALCWSFVMITLIIFCFALIFLSAAASYMEGADVNDQMAHRIADNFGSAKNAAFSLFFSISNGVDYRPLAAELEHIHWALFYVFCFYIFVMVFGILNVLIGVFCEQANQTSALDDDLIIQAEQERMSNFLVNMKKLFNDIDKDDSGTIQWEEFRDYIKDEHVMTYLLAQGLNLFDASQLFRLLDEESKGKVDLFTFIYIMLRLTGDARNTDIMMLHSDIRRQGKILNILLRKMKAAEAEKAKKREERRQERNAKNAEKGEGSKGSKGGK